MTGRQINTHDTVQAAQRGNAPSALFSPQEMDILFIGLMRAPVFFDEARRLVRYNQFDPYTEAHYGLLWDVLCDLRDNFTRWTTDMILGELYRLLNENPARLSPDMQAQLLRQDDYGIVYMAFATPPENISLEYCRMLLQRFLNERTVAAPLRCYMDARQVGGAYPAGLAEFLEQIAAQRQRIDSMQELPMFEAAPELTAEFEPPARYRLTGVPYIDQPLGGVRDGDANGLLGLTGSGKSTMAAHMAVAMSKMEYDTSLQAGTDPGMVIFLTYEESARKMYPRIWSSAFKIPRDKLETMTNPSLTLTTRDNMEEYEYALTEGGTPLCEQERWEVGRVWLNQTLKLLDMSGSGKFPNAGAGYVPEIVSSLEALTQMTGQPVRAVLIDYAGLICKRYMRVNNIDETKLRYYLTTFGDEVRRRVAEAFQCTAWIFHQLAPTENSRSATALLRHDQAAEGKAFAENLAVCGCLGVTERPSGLRRLNWSKTRYTRIEQVAPVTLKINERFAEMEDMTRQFVVDEQLHRFVERAAGQRFHGDVGGRMDSREVANPIGAARRRMSNDDLGEVL